MPVWKKRHCLRLISRRWVLTNEEFYDEVAGILGTTYDCKPFPWYKRTRWNNRTPGSGRYPGYGLVRCFGEGVHIALQKPVSVHKIFSSKDEALDFLVDIFANLD